MLCPLLHRPQPPPTLLPAPPPHHVTIPRLFGQEFNIHCLISPGGSRGPSSATPPTARPPKPLLLPPCSLPSFLLFPLSFLSPHELLFANNAKLLGVQRFQHSPGTSEALFFPDVMDCSPHAGMQRERDRRRRRMRAGGGGEEKGKGEKQWEEEKMGGGSYPGL